MPPLNKGFSTLHFVRPMKRVPLVIALLTAVFLILCLFQARGRGVGFVPPLTDWELHPAWWHFEFLADCGLYLIVMPSFYLFLLLGAIIRSSGDTAITIVRWTSLAIPIAIESVGVFYVGRYLCRVLRREA